LRFSVAPINFMEMDGNAKKDSRIIEFDNVAELHAMSPFGTGGNVGKAACEQQT